MRAKKILFITTEIEPFVAETPHSQKGRLLPQTIQESGHEIRTFSPKWGTINERRNQLHEVIRLSGMNLIIDETDHPLIIKVATLSSSKMQIYFIDNDDYFMKRGMLTDKDGREYADNGERAIFYARGVLETVKKLGWRPDVVHCYGWVSALAPLYIKKAYADDPSFRNVKVVMELSPRQFVSDLGRRSAELVEYKDVHFSDIQELCTPKYGHSELLKIGVKYSDAVVVESPQVDASVVEYARSLSLPVLALAEDESVKDAKDKYGSFYETLFPDSLEAE